MLLRSLILLLLCVSSAHAAIIREFNFDDGTYGNVFVRNPCQAGASNNKPPSLMSPMALAPAACPGQPYSTNAATRHSATVVSSPVRVAGGKAVLFDVRPTDKGYTYGAFRNPGERAELETNFGTGYLGNSYWYSFATMVHPTFASNTGTGEKAVTVAQWPVVHDSCDTTGPGTGPALQLQITEPNHAAPNSWRVRSRGEGVACTTGSAVDQQQWDLGAYETGKWVDWVFFVKWSHGTDGILRVWKNGVQVINVTKRTAFNHQQQLVFKWGPYNGRWGEGEAKSTDRMLVYFDHVRVGDASETLGSMSISGETPPPTVQLTSYTPSDAGLLDVTDPTALAAAMVNVPKVLVKAPERLNSGAVTNEADYSFTVQSVWTTTHMIFLFDVSDDTVIATGSADWWKKDSVAVRLNSGADLRIALETDGVATVANGTSTTHTVGAALRTGGYLLAMQIPKTRFGNPTMAAGLIIPFKIEGNDNDAADGVRDAMLALEIPWSATELNNLELVSTVVNIEPPIAPPVITNIAESMLTPTSVIISWNCNELCTCNVDWDTNTGTPYANTTPDPDDTTPDVTACSVTLTGLTANTPYFYRVRSANTAEVENNTEAEGTFTTPAVGAPTITSPDALWISLYGSEDTAPEIDTTSMARGGRVVFRASASAADENSDATPLLPWATVNGGSATALGSSCATAITCSAPVTAPMAMTDGDFTSQRVSTGNFIPGRIRLMAEAASVAMPIGYTTEHVWPLQFSDTMLSPGDVVCVSLRHENGTVLSGTPAEKCVTIINQMAFFRGAGPSGHVEMMGWMFEPGLFEEGLFQQ